MNDVWTTVWAERRALAEDLRSVQGERWATPSLCEGWDVHDVLAHLVDTAKETRTRFLVRLVAARFDFDAANEMGLAGERASDPGVTLAEFAAVLDRSTSPPAPKDTRLVEAFVHGEDIRRPLGIGHDYPTALVTRAIEFQARTSTSMGGGKSRIAGVTLVATDTDFSIGVGPEAEGPAISLLLATSGRRAALADLSGPAVEVISSRA